MEKIETLAIVQARTGSTRFPKKILKKINDKTLLEILLSRLKKSKLINKIVVVTTKKKEDKKLKSITKKLNVEIFFGSEKDVLSRFYNVSKKYYPNQIVRITGDCPLIDPKIVDKVIKLFKKNKVDYCSNIYPPSFPDGLDTEVFSFDVLKRIWKNKKTIFDKEHVTSAIIKSDIYSKLNYKCKTDYSQLRLTVDEKEDFEVIKGVLNFFNHNIYFDFNDIKLNYRKLNNILSKNQMYKRNEGSSISKGQKLWKKAKKIIPGGNMFFSKNPDNFLPNNWPSYYSKAKGSYIWSIDGKKYLDMSLMSVGTNILGYANTKVNRKVIETIKNGNMSTLNCTAEVFLAEKLLEINPWADMVKFARSGGEANAIAIRIARATTGKDKIAICGYHGWHDWYLAANLKKKDNLDNHLLPGLNPTGVPKVLKDTVFTFNYNNFEELKKIVNKNKNLAAIKLEPQRNDLPKNGFLEKVRKLATDKKLILIIDECTAGFRETFGGLHKKFNLKPDMAIYGKAIANGFPLTAIVGTKEVMENAQDTFISSTFWSDSVGPTAALETLKIMENIKSWKTITRIGKDIKRNWIKIAKDHDIEIKVNGISALPNFTFNNRNNLVYKTFITQEMLKKGILANLSIYTSVSHSSQNLDKYFNELNIIFSLIKKHEDNQKKIEDLLEGPISNSSFKRLN